jgi:DNA polymerase III alpha subunit
MIGIAKPSIPARSGLHWWRGPAASKTPRFGLPLEDETGIANVIVTPDLYERERLTVVRSKFLLAEGILQNQDGVIHIKATKLTALVDSAMELRSHDFH